ncbi:MAG: hypothetical protein NTW12_02000, partial [Deltaproteobacteria bacterium]|nr:hypothetical protein [Deltaproteobacteria bacterium]
HPFHYFGCQRAFSEPVALSQLHFRLGDWKYGLRFQNRRVTFYDVVKDDEFVKSLSFPPPTNTFEGRLRRRSMNV